MKRFLYLTVSAALLCILSVSAAAVPIGTVVNHTLFTDIVAEVDGHPLRSYNVDNHMVIVAEDLRAYGFHVIWHGEERWLEVVRPVVNGEPLTPDSYPDYTPQVLSGKIGTPAHSILATDIVTTVAGDRISSWNINGETVIPFRELERYGAVLYDNETRRSMYITEPYKVFAGGHAVEQQPLTPWDMSYQESGSGLTAAFTVGQDADSWSGFVSRDISDMHFDTGLSANIAPAVTVSIDFYPEMFPPQETLRHELFDTLSSLPVPSAAETIDFTNTPEVRTLVSEVFRVTLNGTAVTGDLWRTQGNGHVDFVFLFDGAFHAEPGDKITLEIQTAASDSDTASVFQIADPPIM